jgi:hypothetical protein
MLSYFKMCAKKCKIRHVLCSGHQSTNHAPPPPPSDPSSGQDADQSRSSSLWLLSDAGRHITHSTLEIKDRQTEGISVPHDPLMNSGFKKRGKGGGRRSSSRPFQAHIYRPRGPGLSSALHTLRHVSPQKGD